eukprot:1405921-Alexandrium_andersonii.AAC.1
MFPAVFGLVTSQSQSRAVWVAWACVERSEWLLRTHAHPHVCHSHTHALIELMQHRAATTAQLAQRITFGDTYTDTQSHSLTLCTPS